MKTESKVDATPSIEGHTLDLGIGHTIAIYKRNGVCWVAEFRDGHGELVDAGSWFRFHAGGLRYCHNRRQTALRSSTPLTSEMLERIERLHRASEARQERMLAAPWTVAASARRYWIKVISRLRGRAAKTSQTFG